MGKTLKIEKIKISCRKAILKKYSSINAFLDSEEGKEVLDKLDMSKINATRYLSLNSSTNFKVYEHLYSKFSLGILTKKVVVSRTTNYTVDE